MESARADLRLVELGLAPSRTRAQELIANGRVSVVRQGIAKLVSKPSYALGEGDQLIVAAAGSEEFVSRGGLKLKGALEHTGLEVAGWTALDIGISTGGFTDCLLKRGVQSVIGLDVGHGQLAPHLQGDARVRLFEGVNARSMNGEQGPLPLTELNGGRGFDLIVIDVSFISLALVLPQAIQYLLSSGPVLALVKPQFEVGRQGLGKNGIVKDAKQFVLVEEKIRQLCRDLKLDVEDYFASSIEGTDGNKEFFVLARSRRRG